MNRAMLHQVCVGLLCTFVVVGCENTGSGSGNDAMAARLELEMLAALDRFQNAENQFGPSTTLDKLPENGHWLDRMLDAVRDIERIEAQATSLGYSTVGASHSLRQRCQQHYETFQSDIKHLQVMQDLESASDLLKNL